MPFPFDDAVAFVNNVGGTAATVYNAKAAYESAKSGNPTPAIVSSPSDQRQQVTPFYPPQFQATQPAPVVARPSPQPVGANSGNIIIGVAAVGGLIYLLSRIK